MSHRKLTLGNPSHSPAHWPGSVVALTALGLAKALPRSLPLPANQPTGRSDWQLFRPLPGDLGRAFGIPANGSIPNHPRRPAFYPHQPPIRPAGMGIRRAIFPYSMSWSKVISPGEPTASLLLRKKRVPARVRHAMESTRHFSSFDHA